jgi:hypothetical protein
LNPKEFSSPARKKTACIGHSKGRETARGKDLTKPLLAFNQSPSQLKLRSGKERVKLELEKNLKEIRPGAKFPNDKWKARKTGRGNTTASLPN